MGKGWNLAKGSGGPWVRIPAPSGPGWESEKEETAPGLPASWAMSSQLAEMPTQPSFTLGVPLSQPSQASLEPTSRAHVVAEHPGYPPEEGLLHEVSR